MPRAVRFDQYGDRDVLYVADVPIPTPEPGEVVVAVRAAGTNPGEAAIRRGAFDSVVPATFPSGQGSDLAGVVHATGPDVSGFAPGDEVLGWSDRRSSQAEFVAVPAGQLVRKPPALPWEVAGSLYIVGVTAWAAVRAVGANAGDTVAVSAAAGGVGSITVQLLRSRGAKVLGIASEANHDWLRSLGVIPVAHGEGTAGRLREAAGGSLDAFIDCFGGGYVRMAIELGVNQERIDTIIDFQAAQEYGVKTDGSAAGSSAEVLSKLAELIASGHLTVPIAAVYPLDRVRDAYAELEQRHTRGKIVLVP
jgi:NADPH:quinone reductase